MKAFIDGSRKNVFHCFLKLGDGMNEMMQLFIKDDKKTIILKTMILITR